MQFGAMNFPVVPVLDEIETFARMGFDYLELAMDPPMAHHRILAAERQAIVQKLRDSHMALVCHLPTFVTTADLTDSLREASVMEMHRSLEVASALGARKVVLHPSMASGLGVFVLETVKAYAFDFLSAIVTAADRLGMTLCLENMFPRNQIGVEADDFEAFFEAFPSLRLTLDTGHAHINDRGERRLRSLVDRLADRIAHLHISDNQGHVDEHLAVGHGTIDFTGLVKRLMRAGYDGTVTLEVFDADRRKLLESREKIRALFTSG